MLKVNLLLRLFSMFIILSHCKFRDQTMNLKNVHPPFTVSGPPEGFELTPVVVLLILAIALLLISSVIIAGALRLRAGGGAAPRPQVLAIKDKATLPLRSNVQDLYDMDDKNPDLIPCNKGKGSLLTTFRR